MQQKQPVTENTGLEREIMTSLDQLQLRQNFETKKTLKTEVALHSRAVPNKTMSILVKLRCNGVADRIGCSAWTQYIISARFRFETNLHSFFSLMRTMVEIACHFKNRKVGWKAQM